MKIETIKAAERAAKVFLERAKVIKTFTAVEGGYSYIDNAPKDTAALRRASMELTRALAEMRKP